MILLNIDCTGYYCIANKGVLQISKVLGQFESAMGQGIDIEVMKDGEAEVQAVYLRSVFKHKDHALAAALVKYSSIYENKEQQMLLLQRSLEEYRIAISKIKAQMQENVGF
jgi:hypothetical protein